MQIQVSFFYTFLHRELVYAHFREKEVSHMGRAINIEFSQSPRSANANVYPFVPCSLRSIEQRVWRSRRRFGGFAKTP